MISLIILGKPFGKQRPKFARMGKFTKAYTPKETVNYETLVKLRFMAGYPNQVPLTGPINLSITIYQQMPKKSKKITAMMESNDIRPTTKPDIDNVIKIIGDALNGVAYVDDKQIVMVYAQKFYSTIPRVEIEIGEIV